MAAFRGWHYRSRLVDRMAVGAFNKKYRHPQTRADWVTSDPQRLEEYVSDPLCSFMFTVKCVLRDVYGDDGDGKEGKHLYDPEESANPFYGRS